MPSINRGFLLVLVFSGTMSAGGKPVLPSRTYALRLNLGSIQAHRFVVRRDWTAIPYSDRNGNQNHVIEGTVSFGAGAQSVSIARFEGKAGKNPYGLDAQLASFKKPMLRLRLRRTSPPSGATEPWEVEADSRTMWGQMMVLKALGEYEIGPFDTVFSPHPVAVGDTWRGRVQVSDEQLAMGYNHGQSNQDPRRGECVYRLRSVDLKARSAIVSFSVVATVVSTDSWTHALLQRSVSESGEWTVSLDSGLPTRFEANKKAVWRSGPKRIDGVEITHTIMKLD